MRMLEVESLSMVNVKLKSRTNQPVTDIDGNDIEILQQDDVVDIVQDMVNDGHTLALRQPHITADYEHCGGDDYGQLNINVYPYDYLPTSIYIDFGSDVGKMIIQFEWKYGLNGYVNPRITNYSVSGVLQPLIDEIEIDEVILHEEDEYNYIGIRVSLVEEVEEYLGGDCDNCPALLEVLKYGEED